jgi:hypothetical protein
MRFGPSATLWARTSEAQSVQGIALMKLEEYDFTRNPIVENQTFFLESKCVHCGLVLLAGSLEELVEEEKGHRAQCAPSRAASSH